MYNCFNNKLCNNLNYTFILNPSAAHDDQIKITFYSQDSKYKIYAIPVKLFANYTIAIDCDKGAEMFCALYNNKLINSKRSQDLITRTYKKVDKTIFSQPFLYDKLDFRYWSFETDTSEQDYNRTKEKTLLIPEKITRWDIANNEKDLKLFIKVPTSCKSSIVILEGDFRTYNNCRYFPPGKFKLDGTVFDENVDDNKLLHTARQTWELKQNKCVVNFGNKEDKVKVDINDDFKPIGKLQLLSFNTGESYPFADRLVEYLVGSAITSVDEIPDNIKRAQAVMNQNNIYFIKGRMSTGYAVLMNIKGVEQKFTNPKTVKLCNLNRISARKSILVKAIPINVNFSM
jgi:hypothetical protein